jgi:hypothetical protein
VKVGGTGNGYGRSLATVKVGGDKLASLRVGTNGKGSSLASVRIGGGEHGHGRSSLAAVQIGLNGGHGHHGHHDSLASVKIGAGDAALGSASVKVDAGPAILADSAGDGGSDTGGSTNTGPSGTGSSGTASNSPGSVASPGGNSGGSPSQAGSGNRLLICDAGQSKAYTGHNCHDR